ncbi:unnamed protein product [Litomosoides sigmodontis]|uniref:Uncharacterized protein n=1 Tax=Litomosoides sigmodontis TaxID=42156 RepID=A0A3P6TGM3_LITSI|nr:unnamed protein product [Litomosoides sigmodontis]
MVVVVTLDHPRRLQHEIRKWYECNACETLASLSFMCTIPDLFMAVSKGDLQYVTVYILARNTFNKVYHATKLQPMGKFYSETPAPHHHTNASDAEKAQFRIPTPATLQIPTTFYITHLYFSMQIRSFLTLTPRYLRPVSN